MEKGRTEPVRSKKASKLDLSKFIRKKKLSKVFQAQNKSFQECRWVSPLDQLENWSKQISKKTKTNTQSYHTELKQIGQC